MRFIKQKLEVEKIPTLPSQVDYLKPSHPFLFYTYMYEKEKGFLLVFALRDKSVYTYI